MTTLDTAIESCESSIQKANNNIRLLGQKQTVVHRIQPDSSPSTVI